MVEISEPRSIDPNEGFLLGIAQSLGLFSDEVNKYIQLIIDYNIENTYQFEEKYKMGKASGFLLPIYAGAVYSEVAAYSELAAYSEGASKSIELKGTNYSQEYINKLQSTYKQFANEGVDITEHGLNRVLGRSSRGVTVENTIDAYNNGKLYYDPKYNTNIKFKDGIAVSYDTKTGQIVNVQTQDNPTSRWIAK